MTESEARIVATNWQLDSDSKFNETIGNQKLC
jgi:hypothetical protein